MPVIGLPITVETVVNNFLVSNGLSSFKIAGNTRGTTIVLRFGAMASSRCTIDSEAESSLNKSSMRAPYPSPGVWHRKSPSQQQRDKDRRSTFISSKFNEQPEPTSPFFCPNPTHSTPIPRESTILKPISTRQRSVSCPGLCSSIDSTRKETTDCPDIDPVFPSRSKVNQNKNTNYIPVDTDIEVHMCDEPVSQTATKSLSESYVVPVTQSATHAADTADSCVNNIPDIQNNNNNIDNPASGEVYCLELETVTPTLHNTFEKCEPVDLTSAKDNEGSDTALSDKTTNNHVEDDADAEASPPEPTPPEVTLPEATPPGAISPKATPPEATPPEATSPEATPPEATPPECPEVISEVQRYRFRQSYDCFEDFCDEHDNDRFRIYTFGLDTPTQLKLLDVERNQSITNAVVDYYEGQPNLIVQTEDIVVECDLEHFRWHRWFVIEKAARPYERMRLRHLKTFAPVDLTDPCRIEEMKLAIYMVRYTLRLVHRVLRPNHSETL